MKKYIIFLLTVFFSLIGSQAFAQNVTFDDGTVWNCDQNYAPTPVRYWKLYSFYDTWNNGTNTNTYLNEHYIQYKNASYLYQGQAYTNGNLFDWTQALRSASYTVAPNSSMQVISTRYEDWGIVQKPAIRSNPIAGQYDFMIAYKIKYDKSNNYPDTSDDISHVECQPYYVTWCGDGILDSSYEQCDGTDGIGAGQTCNSFCQVVNNPVPACLSLTSSVLIGNAPVVTNVNCSSQNATSVSIDCGNGQTINSANGTCTYSTPGYYSAVCKVDGSITNSNCQKNIQVDSVVLPACVRGSITLPLTSTINASTPNLCPAGQSVGWNTPTTAGTVTTYTWSCNGSAVGGACSATFDTSTIPSCNSITVNPTAGTAPLSSSVTCNTTNATSVSIDCGNGQTINATSGTCTYGTVGTFIPRCTVNGTISPASCASSVTTTAVVVNPYSACTPGVPTADCSTRTYATQAACLAANPAANCYNNNIVSCNANRAAQCPVAVNPYSACIPGNPAADCSTNTYATQAACLLANPGASGRTCYQNDIVSCNTTRAAQCPGAVNATDLSLKKFVNGSDAQNAVAAVNVATGTALNYTLFVRNEGLITATGITTVTDTLPVGVTLVSVPNIAPWTCTTNIPTNSFSCTTAATIASGVTLPTITVNATTTTSTGNITNTGTVANPNDTNPANNTDPAVIFAGPSAIAGFDLSLKKYIGVNDAQVAPGVVTNTNAVLSYVIRVTNSGASSLPTSGTTRVQDILPAGVEYDTAATGAGWTCAVVGRILTCTSAQVIAPGASYPDITVPIRVTATAGQSVANIAAVDNPVETSRCTATGTLPVTDTGVCTLDATNSDPAVLSIPGGGGGGTSNIGKKCVNGVASCASYNSLPACIADGIPAALCYAADAVGIAACQAQSLICTGPGGGGCTGPTCYVDGFCGDGVLGSSNGVLGSSTGEECDVVGAPWCVACKIRGLTNPGANPVTDLWMTIPTLAGTQRIGYSWLDAIPGQVAFSDNRMVLGVGTHAFTLADTVGFGIKTQYRIPLILESSKKICIESSGTSMNSETLCTTFGAAVSVNPGIEQWQRADGTWFVNIGAGDYQKINPSPRPPIPAALPTIHTAAQLAAYNTALQDYYDWRQYIPMSSHSANNITLFKGSTPYSTLGSPSSIGPTLNSAFFARSPGIDGIIQLFACSGSDCSATARVDLVALSVKVSGAVVSSIGSPANRSLQAFINPGNPFAGFMTTTSGDTSTTTNNAVTTPAPVNLPVIVGGISGTVRTIADIEGYAVNGNKNVLAVNGDLTVACPPGRSVFEMEGVRTVIVTGDLIIRCNIIYTSSDTTSSWAWITKGGNIKVSNGLGAFSAGAITNIAGVFVSVKDGTMGGDITYIDNTTTQAILRVDGSLYGNASSLFSSRLYARATGAYDILTTGTIINYSNRALVNPPPLLSQYLGNYQVQRVIQ